MSWSLPPSYDDAINGRPQIPEANSYYKQKRPEVKLSKEERDRFAGLADLYSIIKALDFLEDAYYGKSIIAYNDYLRECRTLVGQYQNNESIMMERNWLTNRETFRKEYDIQCHRAFKRLADGVPVNLQDDKQVLAIVAETTSAFVTTKDAIELNVRAVDGLQPHVVNVVSGLLQMRTHGLPPDFIGLVKINGWLQRLNSLRANDELDDDQARQLLHDLETSHQAWIQFLSHK